LRRVSWDEALELIARRRRAAGREAVGTWAGHGLFANNLGTRVASHLVRRFSNLYGCHWWNPTAAAITGIAPERIAEVARRYATTKPAMLVLGGSSMHKGSNGWQGARAIGCLPALTGNVGVPGGGFGPRHGSATHGQALNNDIYNQRVEMHTCAHVTGDIPPGTVWMRDGWLGLNTLTDGAAVIPDEAVDTFGFSGGQASFDAAVEVAPA
jgi:hypothetical protein